MITATIYRPPIHTSDTARDTDGFPLSVLPSLHPSLESSFARRAIRYGLQITRIVVAADLWSTSGVVAGVAYNRNNRRRTTTEWERQRSLVPLFFAAATSADARRIRYIESGGQKPGRPSGRASNIGRFIIPRRRLRHRPPTKPEGRPDVVVVGPAADDRSN